MSSRKIGLNLVVIVALAALFTGIWALYNRPVSVPDWPERISGFSFSPFRLNQNPQSGRYPAPNRCAPTWNWSPGTPTASAPIRSRARSATSGAGRGVRPARQPGHLARPDLAGNEAEIARAIRIANESPSVVRVIVGNEALFRREVTAEQLIAYLDRVRAAVKVPVTTAEQWHVYREHPELAQHVDLIAAHVLPYWEATPVADAVDFVLERARELKAAFPRKPLLLAEVGWPSNGRMRGSAEATPADQAIYLRRLTNALNGEGYSYFVIEAFDQPWKVSAEGSVGAYWGVYNADRKAKFNFTGPVVPIPAARPGHRLGGTRGTRLHPAADRQFLAAPARADLPRRGLVRLRLGAGVDRLRLQPAVQHLVQPDRRRVAGRRRAGVVIVLFTEAHELAEAVWTRKRRRPFLPITAAQAYRPKVSIHVPCYNEPPELLKQTLDALARLDYPDYEVLVIDNNTRDPAVWQPVEAHCARLGERFRFFHVAPLKASRPAR